MLNMRASMWGGLALLMFASSLYSFFSRNKQHFSDDDISRESATGEENNHEMMLEVDAKYAEELQAEEAQSASMLVASQKPKNEQVKDLCTICLEQHEHWQMLRLSSSCSHSFCSDCITKHATTKIQDKYKTISCPGINCKSTLDDKTLRLLIPKETLVKWDEYLSEYMIPESHKLYCPFANCSVLLVKRDTMKNITKVDCPACRRRFCAVCRVPWHSDKTCKDFRKRREDDVAIALAKRKKWMRCPNCKFFVEKVDGCKRIICRCNCSFCYVCGGRLYSKTPFRCRCK